MNLNFPALPPELVKEVEVTRQGFRDIGEMHAVRRTDLRGRDYYWMGFRGAKQEHPDGHRPARHGRGQDLGHAPAHRPDPPATACMT